jgi:hypothetical protein
VLTTLFLSNYLTISMTSEKITNNLNNKESKLASFSTMIQELPEQFSNFSTVQAWSIILEMRIILGDKHAVLATKKEWIQALENYKLSVGLEKHEKNNHSKSHEGGVVKKILTSKDVSLAMSELEQEYPKDYHYEMHARLRRVKSKLLITPARLLHEITYLTLTQFSLFFPQDRRKKIRKLLLNHLENNRKFTINRGVRSQYFFVVFVFVQQSISLTNKSMWQKNTVESVQTTPEFLVIPRKNHGEILELKLVPITIHYQRCVNELQTIMKTVVVNKVEFQQRISNIQGYHSGVISWLPLSTLVECFFQEYRLSQSSGIILTSHMKNNPRISTIINGEKCVNIDYILMVVYSVVSRLGMTELKNTLFTV